MPSTSPDLPSPTVDLKNALASYGSVLTNVAGDVDRRRKNGTDVENMISGVPYSVLHITEPARERTLNVWRQSKDHLTVTNLTKYQAERFYSLLDGRWKPETVEALREASTLLAYAASNVEDAQERKSNLSMRLTLADKAFTQFTSLWFVGTMPIRAILLVRKIRGGAAWALLIFFVCLGTGVFTWWMLHDNTSMQPFQLWATVAGTASMTGTILNAVVSQIRK